MLISHDQSRNDSEEIRETAAATTCLTVTKFVVQQRPCQIPVCTIVARVGNCSLDLVRGFFIRFHEVNSADTLPSLLLEIEIFETLIIETLYADQHPMLEKFSGLALQIEQWILRHQEEMAGYFI